ncbi:uncharacterized protein EDB91DRAFT_1086452 [Suillus paluster]|uniref:uncharacterized protein n=1 Tax=Suillus paluster TaxID=48578 RepID=UPI001B87186A|nr:uncharacterized protein EDB91DRAFT_1086452 [Suillus paluster]KAG1727381.1 hypothetical protein EDB91DRAFT_1086452 [Suillus paluster]
MSTKSHDTCTTCAVDLFLPDTTKQGNQRAVKMPIIKYPYLPLSEQIKSLLKIPGLEAVLDGWRSKPRIIGEYTDIFDGAVCRMKLKGPDGNLFFSNLSHEKSRPDGELHIGVNLGVDWYIILVQAIVLLHMKQHCTIPLVMSNIILNLQSSTRVPILNLKPDVHEHSSWTERAKSRPNPVVLTPYYLGLAAPMEIWSQSAN